MALFQRKRGADAPQADLSRLPRHVAVIMDGNGRWAKRRGLPRTAGHAAGAEAFRTIANYCRDIGIQYFTVYAFSTENWKRPAEEVSAIMGLLGKYLRESIEKMERDHFHLRFWGDLSPLPAELQALCRETNRITEKGYQGLEVNVCLNYGGRDEILRAVRSLAADCARGELRPEDIREQDISQRLWSRGIPDPDLIIRPSGEIRVSNFLLWQSAYAEYYFTDVLWPDFSREEMDRALAAYQGRSRRFGGVEAKR